MLFRCVTFYADDMSRLKSELEHFQRTKIPRCGTCHKDFVHAVDSKTGLLSLHLFKPDCSCHKSGLILSVG